MLKKTLFLPILIALLSLATIAAVQFRIEETDLTPGGMAQEINVGSDGKIYLSDYDAQQIWRIDPLNSSKIVYQLAYTPVDSRPDSNGNIWWTEGSNVIGRVNVQSDTITTWLVPDGPNGAILLGGLTFDQFGMIWLTEYFGSTSKILRFNPSTGDLCGYALPDGAISNYIIYSHPYVWVGNWSTGHIFRLDILAALSNLARWQIQNASPLGLASDGTGGLWWADTNLSALAHLIPASDQVRLYSLPGGAKPTMLSISGNRVLFTSNLSGTIGVLDPPTTNPTTLVRETFTLTPACSNLGLGTAGNLISKTSGTLTWTSPVDINPTIDANGWKIYPLPSGAAPWGFANVSGKLWVADQGRQKFLRFEELANPHNDIYLPFVRRN